VIEFEDRFSSAKPHFVLNFIRRNTWQVIDGTAIELYSGFSTILQHRSVEINPQYLSATQALYHKTHSVNVKALYEYEGAL
jgi:hypothetical protein